MSVYLCCVLVRQPVISFTADGLPECEQESNQLIYLFINRSHSLTKVTVPQQQKCLSFPIPFLTEWCVILNHFSLISSVYYYEGETSSKLFPEQTENKRQTDTIFSEKMELLSSWNWFQEQIVFRIFLSISIWHIMLLFSEKRVGFPCDLEYERTVGLP